LSKYTPPPLPEGARFDTEKADRAEAFFRKRLRLSTGQFLGRPFELRPDWQAPIIRTIFGTLRADGTRQYRTVLLEVPRKNGKSELAAGVACKLLFADREPGAQVFSAAADRSQAGIVYNVAETMVELDPVLRARARVTGSRRNIAVPQTRSFYRVVSADGRRQHGLNPSGVIFDELHTQRDRKLWDAMKMGSGVRRQPLIFAISTFGVPDESPVWAELSEYARMIRTGEEKNDSFLSICFAAGPNDDYDDPAVWRRANPALGDFLGIDEFREAWKIAKKLPSEWTEFLRYRLNVAVQEAARWLPLEPWDAALETWAEEDLHGQECCGGLDLSTRRDVTALAWLFQMPDGTMRMLFRFWLPEENVPLPLRPYVTSGHIRTTAGNAVDYAEVERQIAEDARKFRVRSIGYDEWNAAQLAQNLTSFGLPMVRVRFGLQSMTAPSKEFEARYVEGRMRHNGNPVMRQMLQAVSLRTDESGNICPRKPDRLKSHKRIDGVVAAILALDGWMRGPASSVYEDRGLLFL
jgi:phage terminase large subunit-like protein